MNLADYLLALSVDIQEAILAKNEGETLRLYNNLRHICTNSSKAFNLPDFDECRKPTPSTDQSPCSC